MGLGAELPLLLEDLNYNLPWEDQGFKERYCWWLRFQAGCDAVGGDGFYICGVGAGLAKCLCALCVTTLI